MVTRIERKEMQASCFSNTPFGFYHAFFQTFPENCRLWWETVFFVPHGKYRFRASRCQPFAELLVFVTFLINFCSICIEISGNTEIMLKKRHVWRTLMWKLFDIHIFFLSTWWAQSGRNAGWYRKRKRHMPSISKSFLRKLSYLSWINAFRYQSHSNKDDFENPVCLKSGFSKLVTEWFSSTMNYD